MRFLRARVRDAQEAEDLYRRPSWPSIARDTATMPHGRSSRGCSPLPGTSSAHAERHRVRQAREVLVAAPPERLAESDGHLKPSSSRRFAASPAEQRQAIALLRVEGLPVEAAACRAG